MLEAFRADLRGNRGGRATTGGKGQQETKYRSLQVSHPLWVASMPYYYPEKMSLNLESS